jgi:hypothetical protein
MHEALHAARPKPTKTIRVNLDAETLRRARHVAADRDVDVREVIGEAISKGLAHLEGGRS